MRYLIALCAVLFLGTASAYAETTTLRQQILPIDCIYEVIDVGTQKLRYLTPETCPIDPGPPTVTDPIVESTTNTDQGVTTKVWYRLPIVSYKAESPQQSLNGGTKPPDESPNVQGEEQYLSDVIFRNKDGVVLAVLAVSAWFAFLIYRNKAKHK